MSGRHLPEKRLTGLRLVAGLCAAAGFLTLGYGIGLSR